MAGKRLEYDGRIDCQQSGFCAGSRRNAFIRILAMLIGLYLGIFLDL